MNEIADLQVSLENQGDIARQLRFQIPRAEYNRRYDAALNKATSKVQLKGFRPGRVPRAMVAKLYGESIHGEVMEDLAVKAIDSAVKEHNLKVVGHPHVNFDELAEGADVTFQADVTVLPEPTIANYRNASLKVKIAAIGADDVEKEIESLRLSKATFEPVSGRNEAQRGDFVRIDYDATVEGESFQGSSRKNVLVEIGGGSLAEGIEDALVGRKVDDSVLVDVPFAADHRDANLAGKTATYAVVLKSIEQRILPPVDDEFAKSVELGETVSELQEKVKEQLSARIEEGNSHRKERALFDHILANNPFEVPQVLVDEEIRSMLFNMGALNRRDQRAYQFDIAPFRQPLGKEAEIRVRSLLSLDQIIQQEKFAPSDAELEEWLDGLVSQGGFKSREELNRNFGYPESKERLSQVLAREKMTKDLLSSTSFEEETASEQELEAADASAE